MVGGNIQATAPQGLGRRKEGVLDLEERVLHIEEILFEETKRLLSKAESRMNVKVRHTKQLNNV